MSRLNRPQAVVRPHLSRRHCLRAIAAAVALPALQSLCAAKASALVNAGDALPLATTVTGAPLRSLFLFFPNGAIPKAWWPEAEGADYPLSRTLQPLEACRSNVQVLGGL